MIIPGIHSQAYGYKEKEFLPGVYHFYAGNLLALNHHHPCENLLSFRQMGVVSFKRNQFF
jgi:hypothetical protein